MAAYAYYVEDRPILSDSIYDRLAKKMLEYWDIIDHFHKDHRIETLTNFFAEVSCPTVEEMDKGDVDDMLLPVSTPSR